MKVQTDWFLAINHYLSKLPVFWLNVTSVGDALVIFPLLSFLIIIYPQAWAALFGALPFATLLSVAGKKIFAVPRPAAVLDHNLFTIVGDTLTAHNSLPSGHTITVFAAVTAILGALLPFPENKRHYLWLLAGLSVATFISLSRVAVGAHWPLDVVFGAIFGYLGGISGVILTQRFKAWWQWIEEPRFRYISSIIILILTLASLVQVVNHPYPGTGIIWVSIVSGMAVSAYLLLQKRIK